MIIEYTLFNTSKLHVEQSYFSEFRKKYADDFQRFLKDLRRHQETNGVGSLLFGDDVVIYRKGEYFTVDNVRIALAGSGYTWHTEEKDFIRVNYRVENFKILKMYYYGNEHQMFTSLAFDSHIVCEGRAIHLKTGEITPGSVPDFHHMKTINGLSQNKTLEPSVIIRRFDLKEKINNTKLIEMLTTIPVTAN